MKKKTVTLSQWLIEQNDTEAYRAGKLAGKKHPKVDQKLIDAVGGMQNLIRQARVLEQDEALGKSGMIQFRWRSPHTIFTYFSTTSRFCTPRYRSTEKAISHLIFFIFSLFSSTIFNLLLSFSVHFCSAYLTTKSIF